MNSNFRVKEQSFLRILWGRLLEQTPQFIPDLQGEDDTSYLDSKDLYT